MSVLMDPSVKNYQKLVKSAKQFMRDEIEKVSKSFSVLEELNINDIIKLTKFDNDLILLKIISLVTFEQIR